VPLFPLKTRKPGGRAQNIFPPREQFAFSFSPVHVSGGVGLEAEDEGGAIAQNRDVFDFSKIR
jgi:hypothetical protein